MRLTNFQSSVIKEEILKHDNLAKIFLFGSRVDDNAKGGDIDLLVVSKTIDFGIKLQVLAQLMQRLGEQKIDLILASNEEKAFTRLAMSEGIKL